MFNIYDITSAKHGSRRAENFQKIAYMMYELIKPFFLILNSYVHNLSTFFIVRVQSISIIFSNIFTLSYSLFWLTLLL